MCEIINYLWTILYLWLFIHDICVFWPKLGVFLTITEQVIIKWYKQCYIWFAAVGSLLDYHVWVHLAFAIGPRGGCHAKSVPILPGGCTPWGKGGGQTEKNTVASVCLVYVSPMFWRKTRPVIDPIIDPGSITLGLIVFFKSPPNISTTPTMMLINIGAATTAPMLIK